MIDRAVYLANDSHAGMLPKNLDYASILATLDLWHVLGEALSLYATRPYSISSNQYPGAGSSSISLLLLALIVIAFTRDQISSTPANITLATDVVFQAHLPDHCHYESRRAYQTLVPNALYRMGNDQDAT